MIDSGATYHMTGYEILFMSCSPSSGSFKVKIADGSLSTVVRTKTIRISPNSELNYVLYVPNLSCNLLSINKLTWDL